MTIEKRREAVVERLLGDSSYHIEFNGYLSNHSKHAVIALRGLGASAEQIEDYCSSYAQKTYGFGLEPAQPATLVVTEENWESLLGKHAQFSAYCRFFAEKERELGLERLLERYLTRLLPGCVGSLLHGTIHLGWALDSGNRTMIVEGLAYMAFSYVSCHPERSDRRVGIAGESVLASLLQIADAWEGEELPAWHKTTLAAEEYDPASGFHPELSDTGLQLSIAQVLTRGHPLIHATPEWITEGGWSAVWKQLHWAAALLYMTKPGDFVLLHVITALHALEQIANSLPEELRRHALKCSWTALLGVLFARGEFPTRAVLESLQAHYKDAVDETQEPLQPSWDHVVARALVDAEEHNAKLVYVQQTLWARFQRKALFRVAASHFTTTPKIPRVTRNEPGVSCRAVPRAHGYSRTSS